MTIDFAAFFIVALAAVVGSSAIVVLYSLGIKLFASPPLGTAAVGSARDDETDDLAESTTRPLAATIGGIACFSVAGLGVLFGIYLIVPALHGG